MIPRIKGPFRSNHGLCLGVLKGIADHFGVAPWILRLALAIVAVFVAFWPALAGYLVAALIMPRVPRPYDGFGDSRGV